MLNGIERRCRVVVMLIISMVGRGDGEGNFDARFSTSESTFLACQGAYRLIGRCLRYAYEFQWHSRHFAG